MVFEIDQKEDIEKKIQENPLTVLTFYTSWCGPWVEFEKNLQDIAHSFRDIPIMKVNIEEKPDMIDTFNINEVPYTFFFYNKEKPIEKPGFIRKSELLNIIKLIG
jgi:thioredoxin 1